MHGLKNITDLAYTDYLPPLFVEKLWEVRHMIRDWNYHMKENFVLSWVNCLDERISIWYNK